MKEADIVLGRTVRMAPQLSDMRDLAGPWTKKTIKLQERYAQVWRGEIEDAQIQAKIAEKYPSYRETYTLVNFRPGAATLERNGSHYEMIPLLLEYVVEPPRPYVDGEDMTGRVMCYNCRHTFPAPQHAKTRHDDVRCEHCGIVSERQHFKSADDDPLRHPLGWPYDDPTIPYDC